MADLSIVYYVIPPSRYGETFDGVLFDNICVNGSPIDLNNAVVDIDFRLQKKGSRSRRLSTTTNEVEIIAPNSIAIKDDFILGINPATYFYDVRVTYPTAIVEYYVEGIHTVDESTTRDN